MAREIASILKECPLLADFPPAALRRLAPATEIKSLDAGKTIFREGRTSDEVYVVRDGRVSLEVCAPGVGCRRILSVGPGELLGWSPILESDQPLTATARTIEPSELLVLNATALRAIFEEHPELGYRFLQQLARAIARRLTATRMQLLNLYGEEMATAGKPEEGE